jgi:predicted nucleic acid-binding protein
MSSFLVDSDVIISYTKRHPGALELLQQIALRDDATLPAVSAVTVFEVLQGLRHPEKPLIRRLFASFRCLPITQPIAHAGAMLVREQRERGATVVMGDALIAATALLHDLVLVTSNRKHFQPLGVTVYADRAAEDILGTREEL